MERQNGKHCVSANEAKQAAPCGRPALLDGLQALFSIGHSDQITGFHADGISRYFGLWPLLRHSGAEAPRTPEEIQAHGELFADLLLASFERGDRISAHGRSDGASAQHSSSQADGVART